EAAPAAGLREAGRRRPRRGPTGADGAAGQRRRPRRGPEPRGAGPPGALRRLRAHRARVGVRRRAAGPHHDLPRGHLRDLRDRRGRGRRGDDHRRPRDRAPLRDRGGTSPRARLGL
ncbi:MAG: hypothetical protein AVDCRST_MAG52-461, partial [uncultured Blastococcus sp.]